MPTIRAQYGGILQGPLLFVSLRGARLLLRSEARGADWSEIVLIYPICYTKPLSSGNAIRAAVVDANVHARVDDFVLSLREAGERARLLHRVRVSRGHLKIQLIVTEEKPQHVRNSAANGGMT